jgi:Tfp pilus assembly protein PilN
MIKVNLIRDQTGKKPTRTSRTLPTFSRIGFLMIAALVLLAGGLGAWWYTVTQDVRHLTAERDRLRVENKRIQGLKRQIVEFEKLKKLQESRIQVIEKLKEAQTGPVLLLNHVIQSIPRDSGIWLSTLEQKGDSISIVGHTRQAGFIPDFMTNLSGTGYFKSVDLELIQDDTSGSRFSLLCLTARKASRD